MRSLNTAGSIVSMGTYSDSVQDACYSASDRRTNFAQETPTSDVKVQSRMMILISYTRHSCGCQYDLLIAG